MVRRVMLSSKMSRDPSNVQFWLLATFLSLVAAMGGGSRADIQSLIILRPFSVLFCGLALWTLSRATIMAHRIVLGFAAAIFALVTVHLLPLPPQIWSVLPGRDILAQVDAEMHFGAVWRPLSMVPAANWNAFYALFVPLAVLLLGVQLPHHQKRRLLGVLLAIGMISGFLGLLQAIGPIDGPLYLYRQTSNGSAVGLFANRNHQAFLLATVFPMLAVYASDGVRSVEQARQKAWIAIAIGGAIIPLILVTGSRAGLLVGLIGLAAVPMLYRKPQFSQPAKRKISRFNYKYALLAFAILCIGGVTVMMSRAATFDRLLAADQAEELRFRIWGPIANMAWTYFPAGSGVGSFVEVYQIHEPYELLNPTYLNHAHNEYLEVLLTTGLPGALILVAALYALVRASVRVWSRKAKSSEDLLARLAIVIISIVAVASAGDYPLRTPLFACVFVVALIWLSVPKASQRQRKESLG
jgi:O-antigen ligase